MAPRSYSKTYSVPVVLSSPLVCTYLHPMATERELVSAYVWDTWLMEEQGH